MIDIIKSEKYIAQNRDETVKKLIDFFITDTLIFWSNEKKLELKQQKKWQPLLDILQQRFNLKIHKTISLFPADNNDNQKAFKYLLENMSIKELTACFLTARESKSPLLGLLLAKKQINAIDVFDAAFLEELYQNKLWGTDYTVAEKHKQIKQTLSEIEDYIIS